ncbi:ketoacyl-ACP synthase III family protein [Paraburkholderia bengalensis]|uniref:Ketoacyl-ACP synthase III family protein n=1 Tax=Paraburkholderia bengalensis TaxID=2747562 RepID=A0ABU8IS04_9BURK
MTILGLPGSAGEMRMKPVFLKALATCVGRQQLSVDDAIAQGFYSQRQAERDGYRIIRRAETDVPTMSETVSLTALDNANLSGDAIRLLTFVAIHDHGHRRLWQPAAFLQHKLGARDSVAWSMSHGCNGLALAAMHAAMMLPVTGGAALLVGADRFEGSGFDRWRSDRGLVYGDAAAATILSLDAGFAEILYADVEFIPQLEEMHRMSEPDHDRKHAWDIAGSKDAFLEKGGTSSFFDAMEDGIKRLHQRLTGALGRLGVQGRAVVTPFSGRGISGNTYGRYFHPLAEVNTDELAATTGHTGTADQLVGLASLIDSGTVQAGECVILIGAGAGFSLSAMVIRLLRKPDYAIATDID